MTDVVCKNCGLMNDYRIEVKANNNVAYCNGCTKYIKNIPHANAAPQLHFGKYKGTPVNQIEDLGYLRWVWDNVKVSELTRDALDKRISTLTLTHH